MRVGRADVAGVLQLHIETVASVRPGHDHLAGAGGEDRRAGRRGEVDAGMQRAVAQDRMSRMPKREEIFEASIGVRRKARTTLSPLGL